MSSCARVESYLALGRFVLRAAVQRKDIQQAAFAFHHHITDLCGYRRYQPITPGRVRLHPPADGLGSRARVAEATARSIKATTAMSRALRCRER
jgi:hypothetical protein